MAIKLTDRYEDSLDYANIVINAIHHQLNCF